MRVIGITGTIGAGKGTIVDYLQSHHGFSHFSVRGYLTKIIQERGLELNRDSMVMVANELRANHSPSYIAEQLYEEAKKAGKDAVIESIRTVGEVMALRQNKRPAHTPLNCGQAENISGPFSTPTIFLFPT